MEKEMVWVPCSGWGPSRNFVVPCENFVQVPARFADDNTRVFRCPDCIRDEEDDEARLLSQMPDDYYPDELTGRWTNG